DKVWFDKNNATIRVELADSIFNPRTIRDPQSINGSRSKLIQGKRIEGKLRRNSSQITRTRELDDDFSRHEIFIVESRAYRAFWLWHIPERRHKNQNR